MIQITNKADCCGCTACASVCAHHAINMEPDAMGFLYPKVDTDKCTECGLCEKVCAFNPNYDRSLNLPEPQIYAARHKDMHEIETSRSGAAFIAISDYVLEQEGVVYGAGYTDHFRVVHKRATNKEERNEFKGSKYVQSDLRDIFPQVKADLKQGLTVLFSGTPCQTAGLASYIGKRLREKLILVDIVCHGVPAPYIWRDYLAYLEKKYKQPIVEVNFRDKSRIGWNGHIESFIFQDGSKKEFNTYTYLFYRHIMLRPSCSKCHYTNFNRPSDFTLADYWGWEKLSPYFNKDNKGCSLLLINSEKGLEIFEKRKEELDYLATTQELCIQPNLQHPSKFNIQWIKFEKLYKKQGFAAVAKRYGSLGWRYILRQKKQAIKQYIRR
jgi:coenzyme F420-reducing hydrogenase beta subunit